MNKKTRPDWVLLDIFIYVRNRTVVILLTKAAKRLLRPPVRTSAASRFLGCVTNLNGEKLSGPVPDEFCSCYLQPWLMQVQDGRFTATLNTSAGRRDLPEERPPVGSFQDDRILTSMALLCFHITKAKLFVI